jgi:hypothetical protein
VSPAGIKLKIFLCQFREFIVVNPVKVIFHSPLNGLSGSIRKSCGNVKDIESLASLHLQIFGCLVIPAPSHKDHKRHQHSIEQPKGIENDRSHFVVLF